MSEVTVRPGLVLEHASLEALQRRASLENQHDRDVLLANLSAITLPIQQIIDGHVLVAGRSGTILGFSATLPRDDGNYELDALFVEPAMWRQGIGRVLVDHCSRSAQRAGAKYLHVLGNPHAQRFYETCGFESVGMQPTQFGIGLAMKKAL
jgi:N-acetylglutamate synthase-like GNAT family acetyltransferase